MVHFDCPNCKARIDADSGFRGGVARCEHCGALIHVPEKGERARPARPESPSALEPMHPAGTPRPRRRRLAPKLIALVLILIALAAGIAYLYHLRTS